MPAFFFLFFPSGFSFLFLLQAANRKPPPFSSFSALTCQIKGWYNDLDLRRKQAPLLSKSDCLAKHRALGSHLAQYRRRITMNHPAFDELELNCFFSRTFGEDFLSCHEMRLSPEEAQYLESQYSHLKLTPLSQKDDLGKVWFQVFAEGASI
jgi:hypothetical protein